MNKNFLGYLLVFLVTSLLMEACKVTKTYRSPAVNTTGLFRGIDTSDTGTLANLPWNEVFTDTTLQSLIREGIANNIDIQTAYNRIQQAEAYYEQTGAAMLPALNANAGITRSKFSAGQGFGARPSITSHQLGISSSWEADIVGAD